MFNFDVFTGGGLPIGSILLIEEDKIGRYAKYLTKLFLAEGTVHKHALFVANYDSDPHETVFFLILLPNNGTKRVFIHFR